MTFVNPKGYFQTRLRKIFSPLFSPRVFDGRKDSLVYSPRQIHVRGVLPHFSGQPKRGSQVAMWLAFFAVAHAGYAISIGFEPEERFISGSDVRMSQSWLSSLEGAGIVSERFAFRGTQSLKIPASVDELAAVCKGDFSAPSKTVAFFEFLIRPTFDASASPVYTVDVQGALLAFVATSRGGTVLAVTSSGAPAVETEAYLAADDKGFASTWLRVTIRQDLSAKTWDLFLDGRLVLVEQPLRADREFTAVRFFASPAGDTFVDDLWSGFENPRFVDVDHDAIPDAYEVAHGFNPSLDDRAGHSVLSGISNIRHFLQSFTTVAATGKSDYAHIWYVDQDSGDDAFGGRHSYVVSRDGPKRSFASAVAAASPGDTVVFLPSLTAYKVDLSKAVAKSLTLKPTDKVTINNE